MYSGVSLMKTKKRWTENCKYFSKQFYFNQYQGCYSFDNDLTFSEKKWQCLFFFSLSIPVISIQAGAGFLGQRKKSWGCVRGEKEAFVASASSSLCVFPLHGLFKKKMHATQATFKTAWGYISVEQMTQRVPDPYGFEPLIDLNVFSSGVDF